MRMRPSRGALSALPFLVLTACTAPADPTPAERVASAGEAATGATCVTFERGVNGAVADAIIDSLNPTQNYGTALSLNEMTHQQFLLRFDLSSIPAGSTAQSATIELYGYPAEESDTNPINFHAATAAWSESTVTWNSFNKAYSSIISGSITTKAKAGYNPVVITALANAWLSGAQPNYGLLVESTPQSKTGEDDFASSEAGTTYAPQLVVCYTTSPCAANPCANGGTCASSNVDGGSGFTCTCPAGWKGATCSTVDACGLSPCKNGATCADNGSSYTCTCPAGWEGTTCNTADACGLAPCQHGATCTDNGSSYTCTCPAGWMGATCSTVDACASSPCQNGGACTDSGSGYTCACPSGWTGTNCQTAVVANACASSPCANGGACTPSGSSYTCACAGSWAGPTCALPLFSVTTTHVAFGLDGVCIADLNGDGTPDLGVTAIDSGSQALAGVLLGHGDGTFAAETNYPLQSGDTNAGGIVVADFNGDHRPDLVAIDSDLFSDNVSVLLGNGDGTFAAEVPYSAGYGPVGVVAQDVSGDGIPDLVVTNSDNTLSVLLGKGDGTFAAQALYFLTQGALLLSIADLNGDGRPDVAVAVGDGSVNVLLNQGGGTFGAAVSYPAGSFPFQTGVADLNGDGKPDLVVCDGTDGKVRVLLGHGDGTFGAAVPYDAGTELEALVALDLNGDGKVDVAVADNYGPNVYVLLGNGDGTLAPPIHFYASQASNFFGLAAGDLNHDGKPDLVTTDYLGNLTVLLHN